MFCLVALLHWYIFVVGGVGFVYMCTLVVDWVRLCLLMSVLVCVHVYLFSVFVCSILFCVLDVFVVVVTHRLLKRAF